MSHEGGVSGQTSEGVAVKIGAEGEETEEDPTTDPGAFILRVGGPGGGEEPNASPTRLGLEDGLEEEEESAGADEGRSKGGGKEDSNGSEVSGISS